jgi:hypothetical protein
VGKRGSDSSDGGDGGFSAHDTNFGGDGGKKNSEEKAHSNTGKTGAGGGCVRREKPMDPRNVVAVCGCCERKKAVKSEEARF